MEELKLHLNNNSIFFEIFESREKIRIKYKSLIFSTTLVIYKNEPKFTVSTPFNSSENNIQALWEIEKSVINLSKENFRQLIDFLINNSDINQEELTVLNNEEYFGFRFLLISYILKHHGLNKFYLPFYLTSITSEKFLFNTPYKTLCENKNNPIKCALINDEIYSTFVYKKVLNNPIHNKNFMVDKIYSVGRILTNNFIKHLPSLKNFDLLIDCCFEYNESRQNFNNDYFNEKSLTNILKIINSFENKESIKKFIDEIFDELRVYNEIHEIDEYDCLIPTSSYKKFNEIHTERSLLLPRQTTKCNGFIQSMNRIYDENFYSYINLFKSDFKIRLLKSNDEYINEGRKQRNCVSSYSTKYESLIFSFKGTENITCEFSLETLKFIQCRLTCNQTVPENIVETINDFEKYIKDYIQKNGFSYNVKLVVNNFFADKRKSASNEENWVISIDDNFKLKKEQIKPKIFGDDNEKL
jgi:hypothetical protein